MILGFADCVIYGSYEAFVFIEIEIEIARVWNIARIQLHMNGVEKCMLMVWCVLLCI